jgi:hypothetical protein
MKLLLSGLIALILIFSACEKVDNPITGPTELHKNSFNPFGTANNYDIIPLPTKSIDFLDSVFTVSKLINGLLGGVITLDKTYISKEGTLVTMSINAVIQPLSFWGTKRISFTIDDTTATVHCEPGMTFQRPLLFTNTFIGLELTEYETEDIDFVCIKDDGTIEDAGGLILVVKPLGTLTVLGANLWHFSRYGWVRRHGNSN